MFDCRVSEFRVRVKKKAPVFENWDCRCEYVVVAAAAVYERRPIASLAVRAQMALVVRELRRFV